MSHKCPGPSCRKDVPTDHLMCPQHWYMVPKPLRTAVYRAYDRGKGALSDAHIAACRAAIRAIGGEVL